MLTLCPTPIGNLDDVTPRQLEALRSADIVACEDSRTTGKLFELLGIVRDGGRPKFVAYHDHNESSAAQQLVAAMQRGARVTLVSDAGTPAISDPGFRLVRAAREAGLDVEVLPGAVAGAMAVAGAGLPTDRWMFEGFAPSKANARREALEATRTRGVTAVYYESPHRVAQLLDDIAAVFGPAHEVCVARELTKLHETWSFGAVADVADRYRENVRGELAVVIAPAPARSHDDVDDWIRAMLDAEVKPAQIKAVVAAVTKLKKGDVFDRIEALKNR